MDTPKPRARDFHTDQGLHAAMSRWAAQQGPATVLEVWVRFSDGSGGLFDTIERATKEVPYKTRDGEVYTVDVRTSKYISPVFSDNEPATRKEIEKSIREWMMKDDPEKLNKLWFILVLDYGRKAA